jgi:hypothetical protein
MTVKFTNNASTTVGTGINASATSLTVASASSFPSLSGADDYCYLTLQGATNTTREVVKATALSGNTFTIVRAQDNTSATSWVAGDIVELRMTAALLTDVIDAATVEGVKTNYQYTPTAGQTVFSGADNASATMIINQAALVSVYMNGVRLVQGTDYSVSSANNTVTLGIGATTADIIDIEVYGNFVGQSGAAVGITGGSITGTAITATSLGATGTATLNTLVSNNATISGGSLDGVTIGGTTRGAISGNAISGTSFASTGNMTFGDNNKAIFGAGSDLQIYHTGSNSYIKDAGVGALIQLTNSWNLNNAADTQNMITATEGGDARLFYSGAVKLATSSSGISVTGTVTADGLTVSNAGSNSFLKSEETTGSARLQLTNSGANVLFGTDNNVGGLTGIANQAYIYSANNLKIGVNTFSAQQLTINSTGIDVTGTVTAGAATFSGDVNIDKASPLLIFKESAAAKLFIGESSVVGGGGAGFYDFYAVTGLGQRFFTNSVERLRIDSVGVLQSNGYSVVASSARAASGTLRLGNIASTSMLLDYDDQGQTIATVRNQYGSLADAAELSLDSGFITFNTGTSFTERLRIDAAGSVGIGTDSPFFTTAGRVSLSVNGTSSSIFAFGKGGSSENYILADAGGLTIANTSATLPTTFFNNASNSMTISAAGNVGIGVVPSGWGTAAGVRGLEVGANLAASQDINSVYFSANAYNSATGWKYRNTQYASNLRMGTNDGVFQFQQAASGTAGAAITWSESMRINTSGQVSIGSSFASGVATRVLTVDDPSNAAIVVAHNGATALNLYADSDEANIGSYLQGANMKFFTTPSGGSVTERMRILADGSVVQGNTVSLVASNFSNQAGAAWHKPDGHYEIATTSDVAPLQIGKNNATDGNLVVFRKQGDVVGSIGANGGVPYLSGPLAGGIKLSYYDATYGLIFPVTTTGAIANGTHDLGYSAAKFRDLYLSGGTHSAGGSTFTGATPMSFNKAGSDTYTKTVLYDSQNNTANSVFSGLTLEMGRLTDSGTATPRTFTIADRGATNRWCFSQYGLSFNPASGVASAAESLDSYEEGTWAPAFLEQSAGTGTYTKIGRSVQVWGQVVCDANGGGTSPLTLGGLPFSVTSGTYRIHLGFDSMNASATGNNVPTPFDGMMLMQHDIYVRPSSTGSNPYYMTNLLKIGTYVYISGQFETTQ